MRQNILNIPETPKLAQMVTGEIAIDDAKNAGDDS